MIINNGIINIGDNNKISSDIINYQILEEELLILLDYVQDKEEINKALKYASEKDEKGLKSVLKKVGKESIKMIRKLGLVALEKYIENIFSR